MLKRLAQVIFTLLFVMPPSHGQTTSIPSKNCTILDTDLALDDYRAIAIVLAWKENVNFVVTEGVTDIHSSKVVLQGFLSRADLGARSNILVGRPLNKTIGTNDSWLAPIRESFKAIAEDDKTYLRTKSFKGRVIEAENDSDKSHFTAEETFVASLSSCDSIEVLMLGPATNFVHYAPLLGSRLSRVVAEMRLIPGKLVGFNCDYDREPCMQLGFFALRTKFEFATIPPGPIIPNCGFIVALSQGPVGEALIRLHQMEPSWSDKSIQLWDDGAALYFVGLVPFTENADGTHVPDLRMQPEWFRRVEEMSISQRLDLQSTPASVPCSLLPSK
jgi:hypothetical protein